MGHSTITGLRHYSVVDSDDLRKAHRTGLEAARRRSGQEATTSATGTVIALSAAATIVGATEEELAELHAQGRLSAVRYGDQLLVDVAEVMRVRTS